MSCSKICAVLLVMALASSMSPVVNSFEVFVFNVLDENVKLTVHCKSQEEDLGTAVVDYLNHFNWRFNLESNATINYDCELGYDNVKGTFRIFDEKKDVLRCQDLRCLWEAQRDGIYLYIREDTAYEKQFSWP